MKLFRVHLYYVAADLQVSRSRRQARSSGFCVLADSKEAAIGRAWETLVSHPSWKHAEPNPICDHSAFECESGVEWVSGS